MRDFFIGTLFCCATLLNAQVQISGTVIAEADAEPLAFVNIGVKNKNIGAVSSESGIFSITIPEENKRDTLSFFLTGYRLKSIPISQISNAIIVGLKPKAIQLVQVNITAEKLKEQKHGITKAKPAIHFIDASMNHNDIFEIAQVVKLNSSPSKIASVNLLINEPRKDSGIFRINFYKYDGVAPTEPLLEKPILERKEIKEGWLSFDLKKYNLFFKNEVVMAIEFLPCKTSTVPIQYEVRLGGRSRSFVRTSSMGAWTTPPHHYRMFVTTLEDPSAQRQDTEDNEAETHPQKRLYSPDVKDTFSLFIHLPKDYAKSKKKKYPVLFLLDANVYYDIITASVQRLRFKKHTPEPIVVGIGYRNFVEGDSLRDRDFTWPVAPARDSFVVSGGAEKFLNFIEKDLDGYLNRNYRTDVTNRTLMGHSLAGYFTLFALQKHLQEPVPFFKNYVSASPSLVYGNSYLQSKFEDLSPVASGHKISLLITRGALETEDAQAFNAFTALLSKVNFKNMETGKIV